MLVFSISHSQNTISIIQKDKSKITISLNSDPNDSEIPVQTLDIKNSKNNYIQVASLEASVTGKPSHLTADDYNFDGYTDFACFYSDDGMGVYNIYQLFIFNPKTKQFDYLHFPAGSDAKCGMFCDVKIDKIKKTFSSSCRGGARWHTDVWKFNKNKKLILINDKRN
ncbi:hypothetical protein C4F50_20785 [Flavobacterium sp. KB82]|uniref:VCBS repeat-containing protein n=2 Tax=Flavobacterium hungaricum TaxID=2082725 RepID=A0ABR9TRU6_9FLAO|nr:hypothetical protein [Flavobacterium hungaricum]